MKSEIYTWLADHFATESSPPSMQTIKDMLTKERATAFLLVWPIMEQELFNGFLTKDKIVGFATKNKRIYSQLDVDDAAKHFHNRYQNNRLYTNLRFRGKNQGTENSPEITAILGKSFVNLSPEEKLHLLLYVTYRFRNNIFHGNKGILSWCHFETEIDYCIQFMTRLLDAKSSQPKF